MDNTQLWVYVIVYCIAYKLRVDRCTTLILLAAAVVNIAFIASIDGFYEWYFITAAVINYATALMIIKYGDSFKEGHYCLLALAAMIQVFRQIDYTSGGDVLYDFYEIALPVIATVQVILVVFDMLLLAAGKKRVSNHS